MDLDNYYPGLGCECFARNEGECGCAADWTPREVYVLRKKVEQLEIDNKNYRGWSRNPDDIKRIAELEESLRTVAQTRCVSYEDLAIRDLEQQANGAEYVIESVLGEPETLTSDALSIRYEFLDRLKQLREQAKGGAN